MDLSIKVSHLDRKEIMEALMAEGVLANEDYKTEVLMKTLAKNLKNRHPIHKKVETFTNAELRKLCISLSLPSKAKDRMRKAIAGYFFREYPDAPLSNLNRVLEEDAYYARLTSMEEDEDINTPVPPTSIIFI